MAFKCRVTYQFTWLLVTSHNLPTVRPTPTVHCPVYCLASGLSISLTLGAELTSCCPIHWYAHLAITCPLTRCAKPRWALAFLLFSLGSKRIWLCAKLTANSPIPLPQFQNPNGSQSSLRSVCTRPFYNDPPYPPPHCPHRRQVFHFLFQLCTSQRKPQPQLAQPQKSLSSQSEMWSWDSATSSARWAPTAELLTCAITCSTWPSRSCSAFPAQEGANNLTQPHELCKYYESPSAALGASAKRAICSTGRQQGAASSAGTMGGADCVLSVGSE